MDSFNFLLSLGNESLEIFKPDFDARERLLDALELDADIFVVARALEYAYALRRAGSCRLCCGKIRARDRALSRS